MAFLNKGLTIVLRDERDDESTRTRSRRRDQRRVEVIYRYEGGIADFVKHLNATQGRRSTRTSSTSRPRTRSG